MSQLNHERSLSDALLEQWRANEPATPNPIRDHLRRLQGVVAAVDVVLVLVAVVIGSALRSSVDLGFGQVALSGEQVGAALPIIALVWLAALLLRGAYSTRSLGAGSEEFITVTRASLEAAGLIAMMAFLFNSDLSRGFFLLSFVVGLPLVLLGRYAVRKALHALRRSGRLVHRVVVVGVPSSINEVAELFDRQVHVGYKLVGACLPEGRLTDRDDPVVPVLGTVGDVRGVCERQRADTVLVTAGGYSSAWDLRRVGWELTGSDVDLVVAPSLMEVAGPRVHTRVVAGLPLVHVAEPQTDNAGGALKRSFDLVITALLLIPLLPVLAGIALAIKFHDHGPVFFRQERVGRDGRVFPMLKFRSMVVDAEDQLARLRHLNESDGVLFKLRTDPRVTGIGRVLRKYSLDELPQLFNVLRGHMSLVGPRPPLPAEVEKYGDDAHRRLLVRPGMTGLWQVSGRSNLSWRESMRLDLYYVDNWSMLSDLVIMFKTVRAVFFTRGAY